MGTRIFAIQIAFWSVLLGGSLHAQSAAAGGGQGEAAGDARSDSMDKRKCYAEYESAQVERQAGRLRNARASLLLCSSNACPSVVQADCVEWLEQVTKSLPTVVLAARVGRRDEFNVQVTMDGQPLTSRLDGKAMPIDPGAHTFRFELPPYPPIEERVLVAVGEKERSIAALFDNGEGTADGKPKPGVDEYRPVPKLVYVFGGVALAGLGGFTYFGLTGKGERSDLMNSCAPFCSDSQISPVKTKLLLADISLGIAVASAVTSVVLYVTRPSVPVSHAVQPVGFVVAPLDHGLAFAYQRGF